MKKRLDVLLVEKGFFESREKAKAVIMSGCVYVNNQKADKAGSNYDENAAVEVRDNRMRYVSRGGYKLEKAMEVFPISLDGRVTMDIGASTGGFTDCMLQNGAKKVYAVDVGYGQLAWKLRNDERVVNLERTNMRYVTAEQVPEPVDFFSVDVAFISLELILPAARGVCADDAQAVCLIKPQFEAGRENVGKNGVVRDQRVHQSVVQGIIDFCLQNGFSVCGLDYSPIKGPQGNIEYLLYIKRSDSPENLLTTTAAEVVAASHEALDQ
ncbi:MAG TPA: TlyA family rRNA (cytidine-2'-O)-methyltransferase [Ruminococcaceae bacterium]|nr:TlyA family rRNA (cytidine-2'-O)-methyltransferase [Oscillospiraceae bacterium]